MGATYRARGALNRPDPAEDVVPVREGGMPASALSSREGEKGNEAWVNNSSGVSKRTEGLDAFWGDGIGTRARSGR